MKKGFYLDRISSPEDLKKIPLKELPEVCREIREYLLEVVQESGGHLASNLGVVELSVALHYVFSSPEDKFCWDVGHQSYVHKILTGRKEALRTVRKFGGISGFPKREESPHDQFNTGHAGTSISQALGEAVARDLLYKEGKISKRYHVISIIGDASILTGMALEALNHAGEIKNPFLIILNDNKMSISPTVGILSYQLASLIQWKLYKKGRALFFSFLRKIPFIGIFLERFFLRSMGNIKSLFTFPQFFEEFGFRYVGPIDGHDVISLVKTLRKVKEASLEEPILLHVVTKKGKGYKPAEDDPVKYHGIKPVKKKEGTSSTPTWSYSKFVGEALVEFAKEEKRLVAITPAMKEGSSLVHFSKEFPDRFFDTGISEQHATAFSGALAKAGLIPFLCIYSTFLQRGYDQLIHDIALMNLPVRMVIDRAGIVGGDGDTHQGLYDIAYISCIPNVRLFSPGSGKELLYLLEFMKNYEEHPIGIRIARDSLPVEEYEFWKKNRKKVPFKDPFRIERLSCGKDIALFCEGLALEKGRKVQALLEKKGYSVELLYVRSLRPLDKEGILEASSDKAYVFSIENHVRRGGMGEAISRILHEEGLPKEGFYNFGYPEEPIPHGDLKAIEEAYQLDAPSIADRIEFYIKKICSLGRKVV